MNFFALLIWLIWLTWLTFSGAQSSNDTIPTTRSDITLSTTEHVTESVSTVSGMDVYLASIYSGDHAWWHERLGCHASDLSCLQKWNSIHVAAIIPTVGSILCSIYIIVTGIYYHAIWSELTARFTAQLPVYISICDLIFEVNHGSDHIHNLLTGYVSEGILCQVFGCMKPFSINCQTAWALGTAFYLSNTIIRQKEISFGKYNLYIHIPCWGIPLLILIIGFVYDVYGLEGAWCGITDPFVYVIT